MIYRENWNELVYYEIEYFPALSGFKRELDIFLRPFDVIYQGKPQSLHTNVKQIIPGKRNLFFFKEKDKIIYKSLNRIDLFFEKFCHPNDEKEIEKALKRKCHNIISKIIKDGYLEITIRKEDITPRGYLELFATNKKEYSEGTLLEKLTNVKIKNLGFRSGYNPGGFYEDIDMLLYGNARNLISAIKLLNKNYYTQSSHTFMFGDDIIEI